MPARDMPVGSWRELFAAVRPDAGGFVRAAQFKRFVVESAASSFSVNETSESADAIARVRPRKGGVTSLPHHNSDSHDIRGPRRHSSILSDASASRRSEGHRRTLPQLVRSAGFLQPTSASNASARQKHQWDLRDLRVRAQKQANLTARPLPSMPAARQRQLSASAAHYEAAVVRALTDFIRDHGGKGSKEGSIVASHARQLSMNTADTRDSAVEDEENGSTEDQQQGHMRRLLSESTLHVRGIGGGIKGENPGVFESKEAVRSIFQRYGKVLAVTVRVRIDKQTKQHSSWALVTMETSTAAIDVMEATVRAGSLTLCVTRFDPAQAAQSKGAMGSLQLDEHVTESLRKTSVQQLCTVLTAKYPGAESAGEAVVSFMDTREGRSIATGVLDTADEAYVMRRLGEIDANYSRLRGTVRGQQMQRTRDVEQPLVQTMRRGRRSRRHGRTKEVMALAAAKAKSTPLPAIMNESGGTQHGDKPWEKKKKRRAALSASRPTDIIATLVSPQVSTQQPQQLKEPLDPVLARMRAKQEKKLKLSGKPLVAAWSSHSSNMLRASVDAAGDCTRSSDNVAVVLKTPESATASTAHAPAASPLDLDPTE